MLGIESELNDLETLNRKYKIIGRNKEYTPKEMFNLVAYGVVEPILNENRVVGYQYCKD